MKQLQVAHYLELASASFDADKAASLRACEAALLVAPHASSVHFALGVLHRAEGRAAEARERFTAAKVLAEPRSPEAADASFALGLVAEESGDTTEAARQFRVAMACEPPHKVASLRLALLEMRDARFQEAMQHLRLFLDEGSDSAAMMRKEAQQHLAACLQKVGRAKEAAALLQEAGAPSEHEALAALATQNWVAARDAYFKCLADCSESNTPRLLAGLAGVLVHLGELQDALSMYRRCCQLEPAEKAHAVNTALMRQLLNLHNGAAADYEALLSPGDDKRKRAKGAPPSVRPARFAKKARTEEPQQTVPELSDAVLSSAWCNLGCVALAAGQLPQASALFAKSIALNARCAEAQYNAGTLLLRAGRPEEALERFRVCRLQSFAPFELLNNMGVALLETGAFAEAHAVFTEAVQMRPHSDAATISLARAMIGSCSAEEGLQLARAVFARSDALRALQTVAAAQVVLGRGAEAEQTARACLELDAESAQSWALLGDALHLREEKQGATNAFRECLARDAGHAGALGSLGRLLLREGKLEEAVAHLRAHLRQCVGRNAAVAEAHFDLGTALAQQGAAQQAVSSFRACVELNTSHHRAYGSWARVLAANGQAPGAQRCLELALRIAPDDTGHLFELAALHTARGDRAAARTLLQRVLVLVPGSADAKSRLVKLL